MIMENNNNNSNTLTNIASINASAINFGGASMPQYEKRVHSVEINEETGNLEIVFRQSEPYLYAVYGQNQSPPDRVWKEIYGAKDGRVVLIETIEGKHTPARYESEKIEFEK